MKHIAIGENHLYSKAYQKGAKFVGRGVIVYVLKDLKAKLLKKLQSDVIFKPNRNIFSFYSFLVD